MKVIQPCSSNLRLHTFIHPDIVVGFGKDLGCFGCMTLEKVIVGLASCNNCHKV